MELQTQVSFSLFGLRLLNLEITSEVGYLSIAGNRPKGMAQPIKGKIRRVMLCRRESAYLTANRSNDPRPRRCDHIALVRFNWIQHCRHCP